MSNVDHAWLRMERPTNPMMVVVVIALERKLAPAKLKQMLAQRFLAYPRFRQRVVREAHQAWWEDDPEFDLDDHVHRVALPGARRRAELQELVSELASTGLDPSRPLWQFHLVESYHGGSVVIARIHHCYADGIALIRVLLAMAAPATADASPAAPPPEQREASSEPLVRLFEPVTEAVAGLYRWGGVLWGQYLDILACPPKALSLAAHGIDLAAEAARLGLMPPDPQTSLKGPLGTAKRAAWCERIPLAEVKAIGAVFGCSLNDVLLACVAGALRAYLLERGDAIDALEIRAMVPVNLRPAEESEVLGNHFGLVFLSLPVGMADAFERIELVRARMAQLKHSSQPVLAWGILNAIGMGPEVLEQEVLETLSRNASLVMTNVPGPRAAIRLAGVKVREVIFWVPQAGEIGVGVSIASYMDGVQVGILSDRHRIAHPERVVAHFRAELESLTLHALMQPWEAKPAS
ncbi:MAG: wax ester/triacylglycerol synthase family O-acyltransferase [Burkholderiales bacterium]|nr:wax ester/triacylglycerol synthase family O-acyltransferase [Burkholderiales bacterium]